MQTGLKLGIKTAMDHIQSPYDATIMPPTLPDWPEIGRITLASPAETERFAERFAPFLKTGDTLLLSGDLGSGKTHFARHLIRSMVGDEVPVPSPTFTLVQIYQSPISEIWHSDLYRLADPGELYELGLLDAFEDTTCLIEWPDRLAPDWPANSVLIHFEILETDARLARLLAPRGSSLETRLASGLKL